MLQLLHPILHLTCNLFVYSLHPIYLLNLNPIRLVVGKEPMQNGRKEEDEEDLTSFVHDARLPLPGTTTLTSGSMPPLAMDALGPFTYRHQQLLCHHLRAPAGAAPFQKLL